MVPSGLDSTAPAWRNPVSVTSSTEVGLALEPVGSSLQPATAARARSPVMMRVEWFIRPPWRPGRAVDHRRCLVFMSSRRASRKGNVVSGASRLLEADARDGALDQPHPAAGRDGQRGALQ